MQVINLPAKFFVTSQIILKPSGNFDNPLSVVIIFICDSNGSVGVLKQLSQLVQLVIKLHFRGLSIFITYCLLQFYKTFIAGFPCAGLKQLLHVGLIHLHKTNSLVMSTMARLAFLISCSGSKPVIY